MRTKEKIEALVAALKFYAEDDRYLLDYDGNWDVTRKRQKELGGEAVPQDYGDVAKAALKACGFL